MENRTARSVGLDILNTQVSGISQSFPAELVANLALIMPELEIVEQYLSTGHVTYQTCRAWRQAFSRYKKRKIG